MPGSVELKGDIAAIMQRNQQLHQQQLEKQEREATEHKRKKEEEAAAAAEAEAARKKTLFGGLKNKGRTSTAVEPAEELTPPEEPAVGTYKKATGAKPQQSDHDRMIAEAAAIQFKKKEKDIQKAVRQLEGVDDAKTTGCSCVLL
jgi:hypothetical protein